jgi:hypothetical protein
VYHNWFNNAHDANVVTQIRPLEQIALAITCLQRELPTLQDGAWLVTRKQLSKRDHDHHVNVVTSVITEALTVTTENNKTESLRGGTAIISNPLMANVLMILAKCPAFVKQIKSYTLRVWGSNYDFTARLFFNSIMYFY